MNVKRKMTACLLVCILILSLAGPAAHAAAVPAAPQITLKNGISSVEVSWTKVSGATGYKVYRSVNGREYKLMRTAGKQTTSYTDPTAATNGATYRYKVRAVKDGTNGKLSEGKSIYRLTRPSISSVKSTSPGKMTVSWKKNAITTGYQIRYRDGSALKYVKVSGAADLSRTIAGLGQGQTCTVWVRCYKKTTYGTSYSAWSEAQRIRVSSYDDLYQETLETYAAETVAHLREVDYAVFKDFTIDSVYYCLKDLNGDGINELAVSIDGQSVASCYTRNSSRTFELFTLQRHGSWWIDVNGKCIMSYKGDSVYRLSGTSLVLVQEVSSHNAAVMNFAWKRFS